MEIKIFYSWQSDLPNKTNRTLIDDALTNVAKTFEGDVVEAERPAIDIDSATKGVAGSINIAESILKKIDRCQIFVADVSIVGEISALKKEKASRKSPNPNVLFESGYALKHLGENRTILVMNLEYGSPEDLPFDLRMRRIVGYSLAESGEKATAKKSLEKDLRQAVVLIIEDIEKSREAEAVNLPNLQDDTIKAIESGTQNQLPLIKRYMQWLFSEIETINSKYVLSDNRIETIFEAIEKSESLSTGFAHVMVSLSTIGNIEACQRLYTELISIFTKYRLRTVENPNGRKDYDFDFYKFIGHELFVLFFSFQIRDGNWKIIGELLKPRIYVNNLPSDERLVSIGYIPQTLRSLEDKKLQTKSPQFSLHADMLASRYRNGDIGKILSFQEFMDADLFLFLYCEFNKTESDYYQWIPHSGVYNTQGAPKFLHESESAANANVIGGALLVSKSQFIERLTIAKARLREIYRTSNGSAPLQFYDPTKIGSR